MKLFKRTVFNKLNLKEINIDRESLYSLRAYDGFENTRKLFTSRYRNPRFKDYFKKQRNMFLSRTGAKKRLKQ